MTNHTLEKPNDWWRLYLLLVIPLKFGQDSCHTSKVDLSSSTEREKTPEAPHKTPHSHQEGPLMGHAHAGALPRWVVGQRADGSPFWAGRQHLLFLQSLGNLLAKKLIKAEATNGLKGVGGWGWCVGFKQCYTILYFLI